MKGNIEFNDHFTVNYDIDKINKSNVKFVIIIPCYNEFDRLPIDDFEDFIFQNNDLHYCFINDASLDGTLLKLKSFQQRHPQRIIIIDLKGNSGKGEAIRQGAKYISVNFLPDHIAFLDADLSTPLTEVVRALKIMEDLNLSLIFGSRIALFGNNIKREFFRHYFGRLFATFASIVLNLVIYDTQCGMKIFKRELADKLFATAFTTRWLFDVEIFFRMKEIYDKDLLKTSMREIPLLEWTEKGKSKIKLSDILKVPILLVKIRKTYSRR